MSLSHSAIEYLTHGWPVVQGCEATTQVCPIRDSCWARGMAGRFHKGDFSLTLNMAALSAPMPHKPGARIGVAFTGLKGGAPCP